MKLSVELINDKWIFNYQVGDNRHNSSRPIDADSLCAFTKILQYASTASSYENEKLWDKIKAKAWIEQNAQESLDFAKDQVNKNK